MRDGRKWKRESEWKLEKLRDQLGWEEMDEGKSIEVGKVTRPISMGGNGKDGRKWKRESAWKWEKLQLGKEEWKGWEEMEEGKSVKMGEVTETMID